MRNEKDAGRTVGLEYPDWWIHVRNEEDAGRTVGLGYPD